MYVSLLFYGATPRDEGSEASELQACAIEKEGASPRPRKLDSEVSMACSVKYRRRQPAMKKTEGLRIVHGLKLERVRGDAFE